MPNASIQIDGLDALLRKVKTLDELRPVKAAIKAAGIYLKGRIARYPEQKSLSRASVYGTTFKTAKQRRFFFWALAQGKIEVPYRRGMSPGSQTFGRRWTVRSINSGLGAEIGNNAEYGPYLMAKDLQSKYAKAVGWPTVEDVVADETKTVVDFLKYHVDRALNE